MIEDFDVTTNMDGDLRLQCPDCRNRTIIGPCATIRELIAIATAHHHSA